MISIRAIEVELPVRVERIQDLGEVSEFTEADRTVFESLGIETVGIDESASASDLAIRAAQKLLENQRLDPQTLDALVVVESRVPSMFMSSEATRIQHELGAINALTFSVGQLGCVSVNAGLISAESLIASGRCSNVLLVHGSKPPSPRRFRRPVTINGEGGIAALLTGNGSGVKLVDTSLECNGEYWDLFRVVFQDKPVVDWLEECKSLKTYSFRLAIESRNRFASINKSLLERQGLTLEKVNHFIMQNLSMGAFGFYEEFFEIQFAKACAENLRSHGHLGSMDILFNLDRAVRSGEFSKGDLVLIMNNSPVAAWSTTLVEV